MAKDDSDQQLGEAKPKKKAKKKRSKTAARSTAGSGRASSAAKKKASTKKRRASRAAPPPDPGPDTTRIIAIGGAVLAVAAVLGIVWWNGRGSNESSTTDEVIDVEAERTRPETPAVPEALTKTRPEPPRPAAIPAPDDVAAPPEGTERTESGVSYRILREGIGEERPGPNDRASVHYTGWTTDGNMFDSSIPRNEPTTFAVGGVIAGWTEALQLMRVGEKRRVWIPEELAYGGRPGRPAGMLVFDMELLAFISPTPPETPSDVAAPPRRAQRTESGLASVVLREGYGDAHPGPTTRVFAHYSGWTTDGQLFDSSLRRGEPIGFALNGVIAGWTEGVQLMVAGERRRFWIPEELAYQGREGAPAGMLVFDVELVWFDEE